MTISVFKSIACIGIFLLIFALPVFARSQGSESCKGKYVAEEGKADSVSDKWLAADKYSHASISAFLTAGQFFMLRNSDILAEKDALLVAAGATATLGVAKEVYDGVSGRGTASIKDFFADLAGIGFAAVVFVFK